MKKVILSFIAAAFIGAGVVAYNSITEEKLEPLRIDSSIAHATEPTVDTLILVNKNSPLPDDYAADLVTVGGVRVAAVMIEDLAEMQGAAKADGVNLYVNSAYRSAAEQEQTYEEKIAEYMTQGYSQADAANLAGDYAAQPGHSEHETGLAIDFAVNSGQSDGDMRTWMWLKQHAWQFGFILRYPAGKEATTGYNYEPWHYRYVGKTAAAAIYEQDLTLEEYVGEESTEPVPFSRNL